MSRLPLKSKLILHSSKSGPKLPLSERSQIIPNAVLLCRGILFQLTDLSFKKKPAIQHTRHQNLDEKSSDSWEQGIW